MGLFNRNPKEQDFAGGSKNIAESIVNDSQGAGIIAKRDPNEDFNIGSVITVHPGEEAVFIKNGEIVGTLSEGRHELRTENYPFLSRIRNMVTGGMSSFTCRVYFFRTAHTNIEWGTPNGIEYHDRYLGCPSVARGNGGYTIRVSNPALFISKLLGNEYVFTEEQMWTFFNGKINQSVASQLARIVEELTETREVLAINGLVKDYLTQNISPIVQSYLDEYGMELVEYWIETLNIDENEFRTEAIRRTSGAGADARAMAKLAEGKMAELNVLGSQYNRIKGMDLLQTLAENPGAGGMASAGAGIGMGMASAGAFTGLAQSVFNDVKDSIREAPRTSFGGADRFGSGDVTVQSQPSMDTDEAALMKLKKLLDHNLISQQQYDDKVREILSRM